MRKIEREMKTAIQRGLNWSKGNTMVVCFASDLDDDKIARVYLHGNHIATVDLETLMAYAMPETLKQWPTNTTMSRLRALGINVYRSKGKIFLNDKEI